jgi:HAD superfamily hydrolase (TIGR01549 family)
MNNLISTLIFDWDGTLVDSAELGLAAFQRTFAELGEPFPLDIYEANYSPNWYSTYAALGLPRDKWHLADDLWLKHYGDQLAELIDGVAETLLNFHRAGYQLGVVSSGSTARVTREVSGSPLADIFNVVICNEHIVNKKPHPEGLEKALKSLGRRAEESAYVGDAPEDIQMGRGANVLTIGVRSNYPSNSKLVAAGPDIYLEKLADLRNHFNVL